MLKCTLRGGPCERRSIGAQATRERRVAFFSELKYGIETVAQNYDLI